MLLKTRIKNLIICIVFATASCAGCIPIKKDAGLNSEAQSFEIALKELNKTISAIKYPQEVPFKPLIPKTWYLECICLPQDKTKLACQLGVPLKNPYQVHSISVPCGVKEARYMLYDDKIENYVLVQGSCSNLQATHTIYLLKSPPVFPGQEKDYQIDRTMSDMLKANPYKLVSTQINDKIADFKKLVIALKERVNILESDLDAAILWAEYLEKSYFIPNSWCWDTQNEVSAYKGTMSEIKLELGEVKSMITQLETWDFSNLQ